jgi:hypothetical protein
VPLFAGGTPAIPGVEEAFRLSDNVAEAFKFLIFPFPDGLKAASTFGQIRGAALINIFKV